RHRNGASLDLGDHQRLPEGIRRAPGGIVVVREDRPRSELAAALVSAMRGRGIRAWPSSGWDAYDAPLPPPPFPHRHLQTRSHAGGFVQVRVRARPSLRRTAAAVVAAVAAALIHPVLGLVALVPVLSLLRGALRARRLPGLLCPPKA